VLPRAGAAFYRAFRKCPNRRIPALFATGVEILSRSLVAMLVGNHHGNETAYEAFNSLDFASTVAAIVCA
jgi:hypothetical protein